MRNWSGGVYYKIHIGIQKYKNIKLNFLKKVYQDFMYTYKFT